jgi:hypothetical protein
MRKTAGLISLVLGVALSASLHATTYGSVEPIANQAVVDTTPLLNQPLRVREAFARGLFQCGIVDRVLDVLTGTGAIRSINQLNAHFAVGAGGFAGRTNPSFVYTILDEGPNGASHSDISIVTNSLGYVMSQASGFLIDANDPSSFDFPANYVVINFPTLPPLRASAALFRTVGEIDPLLFATETSGYTQFGRAYLSLQSAVPDAQFIAGYVAAADQLGLQYTPVVNGIPSLFQGGADFPGNDWTFSTGGQEYLSRIPAQSHGGLARLRAFHLKATQDVLRRLEHSGKGSDNDAIGWVCGQDHD